MELSELYMSSLAKFRRGSSNVKPSPEAKVHV